MIRIGLLQSLTSIWVGSTNMYTRCILHVRPCLQWDMGILLLKI